MLIVPSPNQRTSNNYYCQSVHDSIDCQSFIVTVQVEDYVKEYYYEAFMEIL